MRDTYEFTEVTRSEDSITISLYSDDGALAVLEEEVAVTLDELEEMEEGTTIFSAAEVSD